MGDPYTNEQAKAVKSYNKPVKIEVKGYWTREGNRFIYIDYANAKGQLKMYRCWTSMTITVCGTLDAKQGEFVKVGAWKLDSTEQFDILQNGNATLVQHDEQPLALALQPKYVHMVTIDPKIYRQASW